MTDKMDKIDQEDLAMIGMLGNDSKMTLTYPDEPETATMFVYNAEKATWEAKEIIEKINRQLKSYE